MSLYDALSQIAEQLRAQRHLINNEGETILVSVQPFIRALGYNTSSLKDVRSEYGADAKSSGGEKVDFAILRDDKPVIFIEAKAANLTLNENHWKQLHHYFNAEDVRIGILTNGIEYRFYTDLKKRNIMDKEPFLTIDLLKLDERLVDKLKWFTKSGFDRERIIAGAQRQVMARLLQQEMEKPSDELVRLFARQMHSQRLSSGEIKRYAAMLKGAWHDLVGKDSPIRPSLVDNKVEPVTPPVAPPPLAAGILEIPVFATYFDHYFEATLHFDTDEWRNSLIEFKGQKYKASPIAEEIIRTITPSRAKQNGWLFWKLRDPLDDSERQIIDLRKGDDKVVEELVERMRQS